MPSSVIIWMHPRDNLPLSNKWMLLSQGGTVVLRRRVFGKTCATFAVVKFLHPNSLLPLSFLQCLGSREGMPSLERKARGSILAVIKISYNENRFVL